VAGPRRDRCGCRSIAVQPFCHSRRDSPTGPKMGCRLHDPPRSPDAESRPRGTVFGGAVPLTAHAKWRSAPWKRVVRFSSTGPSLFAHVCSILLEARMPNCGLRGPLAAVAGPRRDRCGCRSIAVQPSCHSRRDSPTGPKMGCRLHDPPRSPDAESRPRRTVFCGTLHLTAHEQRVTKLEGPLLSLLFFRPAALILSVPARSLPALSLSLQVPSQIIF
jgi:hypothetical protein